MRECQVGPIGHFIVALSFIVRSRAPFRHRLRCLIFISLSQDNTLALSNECILRVVFCIPLLFGNFPFSSQFLLGLQSRIVLVGGGSLVHTSATFKYCVVPAVDDHRVEDVGRSLKISVHRGALHTLFQAKG